MRRLLEAYSKVPPHELDYTALLRATNVFGAGARLEWDEEAAKRVGVLLAEAEARLDLEAAWACLSGGAQPDVEAMKVSAELELWAFFERHPLRRVLWVGCGAYPTTALAALQRLPELTIDGVDVVPHCTVLCSAVAARLGLSGRLRALTVPGEELDPQLIEEHDGFFVSSAVRPKNVVIDHILRHKRPGTAVYAREDLAHPQFYEPVEVDHPDVLPARRAREMWLEAKGEPAPLPEGCELEPDAHP